MKTKKLTNDEILIALVNKQLEPFSKTIEDVRYDKNWLYKYPVSQEDNYAWIEWGTKFIMKHAELPLLRDKDRARKAMNFVNMDVGLSIKKEKLVGLALRKKDNKVNKPKKVRKTKIKTKT